MHKKIDGPGGGEEVMTLNKVMLTLKKYHMLSLKELSLEKEETAQESGRQQFLFWCWRCNLVKHSLTTVFGFSLQHCQRYFYFAQNKPYRFLKSWEVLSTLIILLKFGSPLKWWTFSILGAGTSLERIWQVRIWCDCYQEPDARSAWSPWRSAGRKRSLLIVYLCSLHSSCCWPLKIHSVFSDRTLTLPQHSPSPP